MMELERIFVKILKWIEQHKSAYVKKCRLRNNYYMPCEREESFIDSQLYGVSSQVTTGTLVALKRDTLVEIRDDNALQ
jgi:hypothetical protein